MTDTTPYRAKLEAELALLTTELTTLGVQNPELKSDWIAVAEQTSVGEADENTLADSYEDLGNRTAIVADLETRYNNIRLAMKKIEDGTYGNCEVCGAPIEAERLTVNPAARTCVTDREHELPSAA